MKRFKSFLILVAGLLVVPALAQAPATPPAPPPMDPSNLLDLELSTGGKVVVLLRPDKAPQSVERIKTLTRQGFYNGLIFHRVIEGFMAQTGDPKGDGTGGSSLPDLKAEFNDLPHVRGVMSMARAESPDSANSQFFIMLTANLRLDGKYTAIGRVVSGMQYVDAIARGEPPENPSKIVRATLERDDGPAAPTPQAAPAPATAPNAVVPAAPAPAAPPATGTPPAADTPAPAAQAPAEAVTEPAPTDTPPPPQ